MQKSGDNNERAKKSHLQVVLAAVAYLMVVFWVFTLLVCLVCSKNCGGYTASIFKGT